MDASFESPKQGCNAFAHRTRILDLVHLSRMTLGDRNVEAEVLALFLRQSETMTVRASNALGLELAALAHTLKGSAQAIGAWRVADCAERLETIAGTNPDDVPSALAELLAAVKEANMAIARILQSA